MERKIKMTNINKVTLSGHLGKNAEIKTTQSGESLLTFSLAVNEYTKNKATGERETYTNWFDCTMFGSAAENVVQYLTKGKQICLDGKLHFSSWEDAQTGQKRSKVNVRVNNIDLCGGGVSGSISPQGREDVPAVNRGVQENEQARWQGGDVRQAREHLAPSDNIANATRRADAHNQNIAQNSVPTPAIRFEDASLAQDDFPF